MKDKLIPSNAEQKINEFNRIGFHYDLVAKKIYRQRRSCDDPFDDQSFMRYIIAGLISFDMGRMMGKVEEAYDFEGKGFGSRLNSKLQEIKPMLTPLINLNLSLTKSGWQQHKGDIIEAYDILSANGKGALNANPKKHFYVGATKILHFLNPELFIIVDSYAIKAFQNDVPAGYSATKYFKRMEHAQQDIQDFGLEKFKALDEPDTPITRIYDKLTFMTGKKILKGGER